MIMAVLSARSEPTRLEAMQRLGDGTEHCVCEWGLWWIGTTRNGCAIG